MKLSSTTRGFTLIETLVVTAIIAILVATLVPALGSARSASTLAKSLANLRQSAIAAATYAGDFDDRIYTLTAAPNTTYPDIRATLVQTPLRRAVGHAIDIIRRRTGRDAFPIPGGWIPHVLYTHLVLNDYLGQGLPGKMVVSPEDEHRRNWQYEPETHHDEGAWQPFQNPSSGAVPGSQYRWPYSSSYQVVVASYDRNQSRWQRPGMARLSQTSHNSYSVPAVPLGNMRMSQVAFPGSKVHVHDSQDRHRGGVDRYYAHEDAKVVLNMFDGSASYRATLAANPGWNPNIPRRARPTIMTYRPRSWEAPAVDPNGADRLKGFYRWTRGGLKGIDFGAKEIYTGQ